MTQAAADDPGEGAAGGLAAVLAAHRPVLQRFLVRRLGDATAAEDVLQDAWLRLSESPPQVPIADPLAYLFRACENAARDYRRSEARLHAREARYAGESEAERGEEHSPEQLAIDREALTAVEARIAALPERTRRIFVAFRLCDVPQRELASRHGISVSAVQKHLQRAYRAIVGEAEDEDSALRDAQGGGP